MGGAKPCTTHNIDDDQKMKKKKKKRKKKQAVEEHKTIEHDSPDKVCTLEQVLNERASEIVKLRAEIGIARNVIEAKDSQVAEATTALQKMANRVTELEDTLQSSKAQIVEQEMVIGQQQTALSHSLTRLNTA